MTSVGEGIGKPIGYAVVIGGLALGLYLFRNQIAGWIKGLIPNPAYDAGVSLGQAQIALSKNIQCLLTGEFCPEMTSSQYEAFKAAYIPSGRPVIQILEQKPASAWLESTEEQKLLGIGSMTILPWK